MTVSKICTLWAQTLRNSLLPVKAPLSRRALTRSAVRTSTMRSRSFNTSRPLASSKALLTFHLAASSSGKGRKFDPEKNVYNFNPSKQDALGVENADNKETKSRTRPDSGEDAFFIAKVGGSNSTIAFGIADGVGGWNDSGVDPADFSHGLCSYMAKTALDWKPSNRPLNPRQLIETGYQQVIDDSSIPAGGSTACVGVASSSPPNVSVANLGDSGFLHLRLGAVQQYSNPQTHAFNTPYQLSIIPPKILAQSRIFGGTPLSDLPKDASLSNDQDLRHGDVVVLATDGVWDNLNSQDVLKIVSGCMLGLGAWESSPEKGITVSDKIRTITKPGGIGELGQYGEHTLQGVLALAVAGEAKICSVNNKRDGPFAKEVQKYYPEEGYHGGKVDDICVLVLVAVEQEEGTATDLSTPIKAKL